MSYEIRFSAQKLDSYNRATHSECKYDIKHFKIPKQTAQHDEKTTIDFGIGLTKRLRVSSE